VKTALLTFCFAWAMPAHADTTLPQPATGKSWAEPCAARIDAAAKSVGLKPGAKVSLIPLVHENGKANPVRYVEYTDDYLLSVSVGDDAERLPDQSWTVSTPLVDWAYLFRRYKHRFGKIQASDHIEQFQIAVDACLKMGDRK
jgi:hypothetical protein